MLAATINLNAFGNGTKAVKYATIAISEKNIDY